MTFNLDLVFDIHSPSHSSPLGDVAGAILAQPDPPSPVPGPIVGAGLPGLVAGMFGLWGWRRRKTSLSLNGWRKVPGGFGRRAGRSALLALYHVRVPHVRDGIGQRCRLPELHLVPSLVEMRQE
jgi:hypothetical protein